MNLHNKPILDFWNDRSKYGKNAGTNDYMLKELEERVLSQHIPSGAHVLDIGSGNGSTLIRLAHEKSCTGVGLDFAKKLVELANNNSVEEQMTSRLTFSQGNVLDLSADIGQFEHITTQRCLINLETKEEQKRAFSLIVDRLQLGGYYYMIEAFNDGNRLLNDLRGRWGLDPMTSPWHNLFFELAEVLGWQRSFPFMEVQEVSHFASTYYYLSRVVYAKLAFDRGEEMRYDSDINLLSLDLPPIGEFGATKLIIWKRIS